MIGIGILADLPIVGQRAFVGMVEPAQFSLAEGVEPLAPDVPILVISSITGGSSLAVRWVHRPFGRCATHSSACGIHMSSLND